MATVSNSWISINYNGSGQETLSATVADNTGRSTRTATLVGTNNTTGQASLVFSQEGKSEFINVDQNTGVVRIEYGSEIPVLQNEHLTDKATPLRIYGTSNASLLNFTDSANPDITSGHALYIKVNNVWVQQTIGQAISGDPGATAQYEFKIELTLTQNQGTEVREMSLRIAGETQYVDIARRQADPV